MTNRRNFFCIVGVSAVAAILVPALFQILHPIYTRFVSSYFLIFLFHAFSTFSVCVLTAVLLKRYCSVEFFRPRELFHGFPKSKWTLFLSIFLILLLSFGTFSVVVAKEISISNVGVGSVLVVLLNASLEELLFRFVICTALYASTRSIILSITISSVLFYFSHVVSVVINTYLVLGMVDYFQLIEIIPSMGLEWFLFGLMISYIWLKTRSFINLCSLHFSINLLLEFSKYNIQS